MDYLNRARYLVTTHSLGFSMTHSTDTRQEHLRNVAIVAGVLLQAVEEAPDRALETVEVPSHTADVVLDENGADIVIQQDGVTVHVRRD